MLITLGALDLKVQLTAPIESFSVYAVVVDPCSNNPPITMGGTVTGTLAEGDCLFGEEKYQDQYELTLSETTAFVTTGRRDRGRYRDRRFSAPGVVGHGHHAGRPSTEYRTGYHGNVRHHGRRR